MRADEKHCSWRRLTHLAYSSGVMRLLESFGFSGLVASSSLLPSAVRELDVMSLSLNVYATLFQAFTALGVSADTRVGHALGNGAPEQAKRSALVATALVLPWTVIQAAVLVVPRSFFWIVERMHVQELDHEVLDELEGILQIVACVGLVDGMQTVLSGVVRGIGKQSYGARVSVVAYWVLGIPIALLLAFGCQLQSTGLWLGMGIGPMVQTVLYTRMLLKLNWRVEAAQCATELQRHGLGASANNGAHVSDVAQPAHEPARLG